MTPTEQELEALVTELDTDGSGDIDLEVETLQESLVHCCLLTSTPACPQEFLEAMTNKLQDPEGEEIIVDCFKTFDLDGSGALSHDELRDVLDHMGEALTDEDITDLIKAVDADNDGEVNVDEFLTVVGGAS